MLIWRNTYTIYCRENKPGGLEGKGGLHLSTTTYNQKSVHIFLYSTSMQIRQDSLTRNIHYKRINYKFNIIKVIKMNYCGYQWGVRREKKRMFLNLWEMENAFWHWLQ